MFRKKISKMGFPNTAQNRFKKKKCWPAEDAEEQNEVPAPASKTSWWVHAEKPVAWLIFWGANPANKKPGKEMQHSSWEVSMCIQSISNYKLLPLFESEGPHSCERFFNSVHRSPKMSVLRPVTNPAASPRSKKKHQKHAVPLEDLRCRHPLPVILLIWCGNVFSVLLDLSGIKGCYDSHLDVSVEIFLLALKFKSQRNNIFQTILSIIVDVLPQNLPQVCYGPKGQAPKNCIDRRHLGRRFALPLPDVCLPVTGVADIRVKAVRSCA